MQEWLENYMADYKKALEEVPLEAVKNIILKFARANKEKRHIFVFGNGGSASNASHFVNDMAKSASDMTKNRFKCLSLNEHISLITAISNDYSYKDIFKKQMENFAAEGDFLLTLSVSGNSPNCVEAVRWANEKDLHTIAFIGAHNGQLAELAGEVIVVNSKHFGHVEDIHMLICHMIAYAFIENPEIVDSD
jgi:D-sedoheptulose 7-phosphate isomerase